MPKSLHFSLGQEIVDGFLYTMWFSVAILIIAMILTLVVKNKIVKKEERI